MKHIVQFSGGKDSTCMLLMMLERGMQVDEITFCDTGMEFPQMYEHIDKVERYIGRKITRLKAEHSYEWYMFEKPREKGKWQDVRGYGWARMWQRWCTRVLKQQVFARYSKEIGEHILYMGIAYDEPKRHSRKKKNHIHPLYDWQITEAKALFYCKRHSFNWGGLYDEFKRVSCWCCPLQPLSALRTLYHKHPELWERLKEMDSKLEYKFQPEYSVEQLEERFIREDNGKRIAISLWDE